MKRVKQLLEYAATHPNAIITYQTSNIFLATHSSASYLSKSNVRSRVGGNFSMSNNHSYLPNNGAVLTIAQTIKAVISSAVEAEIRALYINSREAIPAHHTIKDMGHPQPPAPMKNDNTTALGVVINTIQPKCTKSMDVISLVKM